MNELIKVNYDSKQPTVLGRDLHEALGIKTAYKDWFPRMCEYGFEEGKDFNPLKNERVQMEGSRAVSRMVTDHQITIPMAKELCMIQRTEVGRKYRQYFLAVEAKWNDPDAVIARGYELSQRKLAETMQLLTEKEEEIAEMKPKASYYDIILNCKDLMSVTQIAKDYGKSAIELNEFLCRHKIQYKQGRNWFLYQKYADKGYAQSKTQMFPSSDGEMHAKVHTYWTHYPRSNIIRGNDKKTSIHATLLVYPLNNTIFQRRNSVILLVFRFALIVTFLLKNAYYSIFKCFIRGKNFSSVYPYNLNRIT